MDTNKYIEVEVSLGNWTDKELIEELKFRSRSFRHPAVESESEKLKVCDWLVDNLKRQDVPVEIRNWLENQTGRFLILGV